MLKTVDCGKYTGRLESLEQLYKSMPTDALKTLYVNQNGIVKCTQVTHRKSGKRNRKKKKGTNKIKTKEGPNVSIITENANSMTI